MKNLSLLLICSLFFAPPEWSTDFAAAKQKAIHEHKCILLNFSGSDWCGPCIKLEKELFTRDDFRSMADSDLVLVNADFPRQKKNQLSKELQKQNNSLAEAYNETGIFPLTVLLTADGKLIKKWEGFPAKPELFISQVKSAADAAK